MNPWGLAGEASDEAATSAAAADAYAEVDAAVSQSAFEVDGSTGAKGPGGEGPSA